MTRTIVCFGDSNTHGAKPDGSGRHPRHVRWPRVMEQALGHSMPHLSMGMSGDFEVGIEEGATLVRVGTALFGDRSGAH